MSLPLRFFDQPSALQLEKFLADSLRFKKKGKRPGLLIIGLGMMGREHLRVIGLLGFSRAQGIYDPDPRSVELALLEWNRLQNSPLKIYSDLNTGLLDKDVDGILICTPNHTHYKILKKAMSTGKPILLEKPMATSLAEAFQIVNLADQYPTFIQLGMQYRYKAQYIDAFYELKKLHSVGEIKTIVMSEYRPPFLDKVNQWNKFNQSSGGTLVEKCCHYFDLINLMAESRPQKIFAVGGQAVNFLDFELRGFSSDIDDHAMVIIEYENKIKASFVLNMFSEQLNEELIVGGRRGRLVTRECASFDPKVASEAHLQVEVPGHEYFLPSVVSYPTWIEQSGHYGATFFEHVAFHNQLAGHVVDAATPKQALWSLIIASAAQLSIQSHKEIDLKEFCSIEGLGSFFEAGF